MKKFFLLLLMVSSISLSALAQSATWSCGTYLKRNPENPAEVQIVFKPMNSSVFRYYNNTEDLTGFTNLAKIETNRELDGRFTLLIPDDDVTAEMKLLLNNAIPASGVSYKVTNEAPTSFVNANDGKTYRVLKFSFEAVYPDGFPSDQWGDPAFEDLSFTAGQEYVIASFTFTNLEHSTTPVWYIRESYADPSLRTYCLQAEGNVKATDVNGTVVYGGNVFHSFPVPYDMLTTQDGSYTGDCETVRDFHDGPDPVAHPNFLAYQELPPYNPLPVSFGPVTATIANGQLLVHWSTLTETNNDHFIIEASKDGKTFTKLTEVKSQAVNGNSNAELTYNYATPLGAATSVLGALAFLGIGLAGFSTKKKLLLAATTLAVIAFTYSCSKKDMPAADAQQKIWVRIAQVDKDGTTKYSKAVEAVRE